MFVYLSKVWDYHLVFKAWQIQQVPRAQNFEVDSLAKLASVPSSELSRTILLECLGALSIQGKELLPLTTDLSDRWQALIIWYLQDEVELACKEKARKLSCKASHYMLIDNVLYKWNHSVLFLRCLDHE